MPTPTQGLSEKDHNIIQWREDVSHAQRTRRPPSRLAASSLPLGVRVTRRVSCPSLSEVSGNRQRNNLRRQSQIHTTNRSTRKGQPKMFPGRPSVHHGRGRGHADPSSRGNHQGGMFNNGDEGTEKLQPALPARGQARRGPGRPRKVPFNARGNLSSGPSNPSTRWDSRFVKTNTYDQPKKVVSVDLPYLACCDPPVKKMAVQSVREHYPQLCGPTMALYSKIHRTPAAIIPRGLQVKHPRSFMGCDTDSF